MATYSCLEKWQQGKVRLACESETTATMVWRLVWLASHAWSTGQLSHSFITVNAHQKHMRAYALVSLHHVTFHLFWTEVLNADKPVLQHFKSRLNANLPAQVLPYSLIFKVLTTLINIEADHLGTRNVAKLVNHLFDLLLLTFGNQKDAVHHNLFASK